MTLFDRRKSVAKSALSHSCTGGHRIQKTGVAALGDHFDERRDQLRA
jgi:hypothetical protein